MDPLRDYSYKKASTPCSARPEIVWKMKLRTQEDFVDAVSKEISWRKRELTEIKSLVEMSEDEPLRQAAMIRCAVALLYAHFEGFIKKVSEAYLNYVGMQRLRNEELSSCMLAVVMRGQIKAAEASNKINAHVQLVEYFRTKALVRARIPYKNIIQTESNLSSVVFAEILAVLDISPVTYAGKYKLIDSKLLEKRNHIAHGNNLDIDFEEYTELHEQVTELLTLFRNDIENAVVMRFFAKPTNTVSTLSV